MAIELGAVEEWVLENDSDDYHPFHMHVNPFQIVEISDRLIPPGTWLDTVLIPPQRFGVPGRVVMRTRIRRFIVSAQATTCAVSLDVAWKRHGMSSSMRLMGWPSRMAVMVAAR